MTIQKDITESLAQLNVQFIKKSGVWNIHNSQFSKACKFKKDIQKIKIENPDIDEITVVIGAIGRTQHSKTEVLIFDSTKKTGLIGTKETLYRDFYVYI